MSDHGDLTTYPDHNAAGQPGGSANVKIKLVGSVVNAIDIIEYLGQIGRRVGVTQIASSLKMNRSTCFNILKTLAARNLVTFDPTSKTYVLGLGLASMARNALDPINRLDAIRPETSRVAREFQLVVSCWRRASRNRIVLVERADPETSVRIHMSIGQRLPVLSGATGRILLAYDAIAETDLEALFATVQWHKKPSLDQLRSETELVRNQGWAIDKGEFLNGVTTIGVPLLNAVQEVEYMCCGTTFEGHLSPARIKDLAQRLLGISDIDRRARTL